MRTRHWLMILAAIVVISVALIILKGGARRVGPSIILISVDTLRPDHLGCYGYDRDTSPALDAFARESLRFEGCFSQAPNTRPSCSTIITGYLPHETQVHSNRYALPAGLKTVAEILSQHGYRTLAVISNYVLTSGSGFDQGFQFFDDRMDEVELIRGVPERIAEHTTNAAIGLMRLNRKKSFFMWIHYQDPHGPYTPRPPYDRMFVDPRLEPIRLKASETVSGVGGIPTYQKLPDHDDYNYYVAQYDGEIRYFDEHFKRLIKSIRELGLYDNSMIILTSDHGEGMGERDYYFAHGEFVYDNLIHVPLVVHMGPDLKGVIGKTVQLLDIVPTILKAAGMVPGSEYRGTSLLEEIPSDRTVFSEMPGKYAVIRDSLKLIYSEDDRSGYQLFNLAVDPGETVDIAGDETYESQVNWMAREMSAVRKEDFLRGRVRGEKPRLSREEKEKLKALGYVQ